MVFLYWHLILGNYTFFTEIVHPLLEFTQIACWILRGQAEARREKMEIQPVFSLDSEANFKRETLI